MDQDIFYRFGDRRAEPIVGNFDPPPPSEPGTADLAGLTVLTDDVSDRRAGAYETQLDKQGRAGYVSEISARKDRDWYLVTAPKSGVMTIDVTTPSSDLGVVLTVQPAGGQRKAALKSTGFNGSADPHLEYRAQAGDQFYVQVRGKGRYLQQRVGRYALRLGYLNPPSPADDHADVITAPNLAQAAFGTELVGSIGQAGDHDFFQLSVAARSQVQLLAQGRTEHLDTVLSLYDSLGNLIAQDESDLESRSSILDLELDAGDYYLRVSGQAGLRGEYQLAVDRLLGG